MDGGVWERVSASFAQHSREDAWRAQIVAHASPRCMTSGTFQGGYSAIFIASRRVLLAARRVLYPSKTA